MKCVDHKCVLTTPVQSTPLTPTCHRRNVNMRSVFVSAKLRRPDHYIHKVQNLQWQVLVHVQALQWGAVLLRGSCKVHHFLKYY